MIAVVRGREEAEPRDERQMMRVRESILDLRARSIRRRRPLRDGRHRAVRGDPYDAVSRPEGDEDDAIAVDDDSAGGMGGGARGEEGNGEGRDH